LEFARPKILLQQICPSESFDDFSCDYFVCPIVVPSADWKWQVANIDRWLFKYGIDNFQCSIAYRHPHCLALKCVQCIPSLASYPAILGLRFGYSCGAIVAFRGNGLSRLLLVNARFARQLIARADLFHTNRPLLAICGWNSKAVPAFVFPEDKAVNRILKPVIYLLATVYFLADAIFMPIARPAADWFSRRLVLDGLRSWIEKLHPYPALALFAVPVLLLEPVKPVAAYLAATGHIAISITALIVGEVLKLVLVERLFGLTRDKLMTIPAFAWVYARFSRARDWLESSGAWRSARRLSKIAFRLAGNYVAALKSSRRVFSSQSR
jgi:hypothetical protein